MSTDAPDPITVSASFIHANVSWTFGPLRYVIATPLFHRWPQTKEDEALDKNFAVLLPLWDILFGTFYLPAGRERPSSASKTTPSLTSFRGQIAHLFRTRRDH